MAFARPDGPAVLIVGAGPSGLALAVELARFDVPVRLIDRAAEPSTTSKALALQARTLELLEPSGVTERLAPHLHHLRGVTLAHDGREVATIRFGGTPSQYQEVAVVPQSRTEAVLAARARELGAGVERGVELVALDEGDAGVDVTLRGARDERVRVRWVAGCDGAHSAVRHLTGRRFTGHAVEESLALADAALETTLDPSRAFVSQRDGAGLGALFPYGGDRWRVLFADGAVPETLDRAAIDAALRSLGFAARVTDLGWTSHFRISQRIVDRYATKRTFLLGDAAHIHSPIGGQGMNTGIADAVNLAWKIALVYHAGVDERLLETYARERQPVGRTLLRATDLANRALLGAPPWASALRDVALRRVARHDALRVRIAETIGQLRVRYTDSPLSVGDGKTPFVAGARVKGARPVGYRPQPLLLPAVDGPALTLVVRPDGYSGYVARGLQPGGAAIYLRNVIGLRDALRVP